MEKQNTICKYFIRNCINYQANNDKTMREIVETIGREYEYLAFNMENKVLSNPEVRQAISYAIDKKAIRSRKSPEKFLEECREVWGNRYDLSKTVYTGIYEQITVICKEHGEFTIRANDFVNGHGCQECGGTKRLTTSTFMIILK